MWPERGNRLAVLGTFFKNKPSTGDMALGGLRACLSFLIVSFGDVYLHYFFSLFTVMNTNKNQYMLLLNMPFEI